MQNHSSSTITISTDKSFLQHDEFQQLGKWLLATKDAHELYRQLVFVEKMPSFYMEKT